MYAFNVAREPKPERLVGARESVVVADVLSTAATTRDRTHLRGKSATGCGRSLNGNRAAYGFIGE
jgi:hypothetical protein